MYLKLQLVHKPYIVKLPISQSFLSKNYLKSRLFGHFSTFSLYIFNFFNKIRYWSINRKILTLNWMKICKTILRLESKRQHKQISFSLMKTVVFITTKMIMYLFHSCFSQLHGPNKGLV